MKKTCFNCKYFHSCLAEEPQSNYHIHNYCDKLNRVLGDDLKSELSVFLEEQWDVMARANIGYNYAINDDFETGEAMCWMFFESDKPFWPDEAYEETKRHNLDLAIRTLEFMFEEDIAYDKFEHKWAKLNDCYDKKELAYFKSLLARLKKEQYNGD